MPWSCCSTVVCAAPKTAAAAPTQAQSSAEAGGGQAATGQRPATRKSTRRASDISPPRKSCTAIGIGSSPHRQGDGYASEGGGASTDDKQGRQVSAARSPMEKMKRQKSIACIKEFLNDSTNNGSKQGGTPTNDESNRNVGSKASEPPTPLSSVSVTPISRKAEEARATFFRKSSTEKSSESVKAPVRGGAKGNGSESDGDEAPMVRMNSQAMFADASQTFIVFDWDDTLFPTTYVRDDMDLSWWIPLMEQKLPKGQLQEVQRNLRQCEEYVVKLLRFAVTCGRVVLVTLARAPWVSQCCSNFFSEVGTLIRDLKVPVVYAQEGAHVDYNKLEMSSNEEVEKHWSELKGKAIAHELELFYSQYKGQSWKNVISIGDSDFERLGTQFATAGYMKQTGIVRQKTVNIGGHVYKVRTKTFKMMDEPTCEELVSEVPFVEKLLPLMVKLDGSFDVNLSNVEDPETLRNIEITLKGGKS